MGYSVQHIGAQTQKYVHSKFNSFSEFPNPECASPVEFSRDEDADTGSGTEPRPPEARSKFPNRTAISIVLWAPMGKIFWMGDNTTDSHVIIYDKT